ncbi:formin-like isoform X2 [Ciona intestinalis]
MFIRWKQIVSCELSPTTGCATPSPTTGWSTTPSPTTGWSTTPSPTTGWCTTPSPTTGWSNTPSPTTGWNTTPSPTTGWSTTSSPTTGWSTTPSPTTRWSTTPSPTTGWSTTPSPTTRWSTTPSPTTRWSNTPSPTTGWNTTPPPPPGGTLPPPPPPGGAPPPPPPPGGAPPPPPPPGGAPPPPPPPGGAVTPFKPMKPLYWIRLNQRHSNQTIEQKKTLWENVEVVKLDEVDLVNLFAKTSLAKQKKPLNTTLGQKKKKKEKFGKVLDLKRSQAVGIFISSLHIDVDDIQNAILTLDTSIVDVEIMEAIWEIRPQFGEMEKIEHFVSTQKKVDEDQRLSLDRPEEFLYKLWQIPDLSHRLFCITFLSRFDQDVSHVTQTIALINDVCEALRGDVVKKLLSIILSVGNYLNGGNVSRGQARGFDLEILGKLKDVKSNVGGVTLLSYIISLYIQHYKQDNDLETWESPVPDTLSLMRASQVKYEDICGEVTKLKTKLNDCRLRVKKVVGNEDNKYVEPFREKMTDFIETAQALVTDKEKEISDSKISFESVLHYFNCGCGKSKIKQPKDFFDMWIPFSVYFSEVWPVQIRAEVKKQKSEAATKVDELRSVQVVRTRTRKRCLKKRLAGQLPDQ